MGFRTTFVSIHTGFKFPEWFIERHKSNVNFYIEGSPLSSKAESKFYSEVKETKLFDDIQKVLIEVNYEYEFTIVLLHECGGVGKVVVTQSDIILFEPVEYKEIVDGYNTHGGCCGFDCHKKLTYNPI